MSKAESGIRSVKGCLGVPGRLLDYLGHRTLGRTVRIEASSLCQLKCARCPALASDENGLFDSVIGRGSISFDDFRHIIDSNPWINRVELSNWGEIFLNPRLKDIIEYAYSKGVVLYSNNGVNLNHAADDVLDCMVRCGFDLLTVSISGATNDVYKIYHVNGDLERVVANIRAINGFKKRYNKKKPELVWKFVVFGHNQGELALARKMAAGLGMSFKAAPNDYPQYSPLNDAQAIRGYPDSPNAGFCHQLWRSPQINWDGKLLGCCRNIYGDFGNVLEEGLSACLRGGKYIYAKRMLLRLSPASGQIPCASCPEYKSGSYLRNIRHFGMLSFIDGRNLPKDLL